MNLPIYPLLIVLAASFPASSFATEAASCAGQSASQTAQPSSSLPEGFSLKTLVRAYKEMGFSGYLVACKDVTGLSAMGFKFIGEGTDTISLGTDETAEEEEVPTRKYEKNGIIVTLIADEDASNFYGSTITFPNTASLNAFLKTATSFCMQRSEWSDTSYTLKDGYSGLVGLYVEGLTVHFDFNP